MTTEAKLGDLQLKVFDLIRLAGWEGKTCDEVEVELSLTHQSASARVHELENMKPTPLIERRGIRRKTRAGRSAFVFVQYGLKAATERAEPKSSPREEPMCSSCKRNITDSPAGGCKTPKEHG